MGKSKEKNLCKWDKNDYSDRIDSLREIVVDAEYVCRKCGRAANDKHRLCKPVSLKK